MFWFNRGRFRADADRFYRASLYVWFCLPICPACVAVLYKYGVTWREGFTSLAGVSFIAFFASFAIKNQKPMGSISREKRSGRPWGAYTYFGIFTALYVQAELLISSRLVIYVRRVHHVKPEEAPHYSLFFS